MMLYTVLAVAGTVFTGYLLGSISFGIIFTRLYTKTDVRDMGSGNTGMTNVLRTVGTLPGLLTGLGDFAKGIASMLIGQWLFTLVGLDSYSGKCLAAVFVLLGHLFPIFFQFRGGKGVMTSAGIVFMLDPYMLGIGMLIFGIAFIITRIVSLSALAAATFLPGINLILAFINDTEKIFSTIFITMITVLFYITLRDNIKRMKKGEEAKLRIKKPQNEAEPDNS